MTKEIFGGRYEVSDDGKVYTNVKYKERKELVGKVGKSGYRMVVLTVDGKKLYKNVHRLVAENFLDNPENKMEVNHIDGNKLNNAATNLEWVTAKENQLHARDVIGYKTAKLSIGRTKVEGRTFQLKFWDCDWGLPWVKVSEIVVKPKRKHWFSSKTVMAESEVCIDYGWMDGNRLDWAMRKINQYLQAEKDKLREAQEIEAFCKT